MSLLHRTGRLTGGLRGGIIVLTVLAALELGASPLSACNVPVFQFALNRWGVEPYTLLVLHRGPLTAQQKQLLDRLTEASQPDVSGSAPLCVEEVDVDGTVQAEQAALLEARKSAPLPRMLLCWPEAYGFDQPCWEAPLDDPSVRVLLEGPVRNELAGRLGKEEGDAAVWIFIPCGNGQKDQPALKLLNETLKKMECTLDLNRLADPADNEAEALPGEFDTPAGRAVKVQYSLMQVRRNDPRDPVLSAMLSRLLAKAPADQPAAIPLFARARAIEPMLGADITAENIQAVGKFLTAACSCALSEERPGLCLFCPVNWSGGDVALLVQGPSSLVPYQATSTPAGGGEASACQGYGVSRVVIIVATLAAAGLVAGTMIVLRRRRA